MATEDNKKLHRNKDGGKFAAKITVAVLGSKGELREKKGEGDCKWHNFPNFAVLRLNFLFTSNYKTAQQKHVFEHVKL